MAPIHLLALQHTGQTIRGFSRHTTALTNNVADEATGRTRNIYIRDRTPTGRTIKYQTTGTSKAAQIPDVARGGAGRPSTATTRHARITEETSVRPSTATTRPARITEETSGVDSYKKGGMVKKTGLAYLHKGEMVVPKKDVNKVKKAMKGK